MKRSCFELSRDGKYGLFLSEKTDGKMIITDYWKVLVLNFSLMGNMVFFWVKKLMERWYLLGLFELFMIFQGLENMVFHAVYLHSFCRAAAEYAQPVHDVLGTSPEDPLKVPTSGTYSGPSGDQYKNWWFNEKIYF